MSDTQAINGAFNAVLNASSWASCLERIRTDLAPKVCGLADENAALREEIAVLRHYGNSACTHMADKALAEQRDNVWSEKEGRYVPKQGHSQRTVSMAGEPFGDPHPMDVPMEGKEPGNLLSPVGEP